MDARLAWGLRRKRGVSAIDFAAVADAEDDDLLVLNVADDAVVADAIAPEAAEFRSLEGVAEATRIFEFGYALVQKL